jgi:hypothetical protein
MAVFRAAYPSALRLEGEVPRIESPSRFWRNLDLDADPSSVFGAL